MSYTKHWDWSTLVLYLFLSIILAYFYKKSISAKKKNLKISLFGIFIHQKYVWYSLIYCIYILFSCFRYIAPGIGGADTLVYIEHFENMTYVPFRLKELFWFSGYEYLFFNLMYLVKLMGGNYFIFSWIVYSIIIICHIFVVDRTIHDEKNWIWFVLWFLPLLKSLNIIRNCLAAAIGVVAITYLNDNKRKRFFLLATIAFLNHYIAIVFFLFGIFCWIVPNKWIENRKYLLSTFMGSIILTILLLPTAKKFLELSGFSGYLNKIEISLIGYLPIFILYLFMLIKHKEFLIELKQKKHEGYYKVMIFLSLVLPIFIMLNGASRILLLFEVPRYILYADLYQFYRNKIPKNGYDMYDTIVSLGIISWFLFRIWRMWDGYSLMPYINILFQ